MKANDIVKSPVNTGTVVAVEGDTVTIRWNGFMGPVKVPANVAATFEVMPAPEIEDSPYEDDPYIGSLDEGGNGSSTGGREDFHSDG